MTATLIPHAQPIIEAGAEFADVDHALAQQLLKEFKAAKAVEAAGKAAVAAAKAKLLEVMAGCDVLRDELTGQELVVNRQVESNVFNATKFRKDYPGLVVGYMETQLSKPFKVVG